MRLSVLTALLVVITYTSSFYNLHLYTTLIACTCLAYRLAFSWHHLWALILLYFYWGVSPLMPTLGLLYYNLLIWFVNYFYTF